MADIKFRDTAHRDFFLENMMKCRVNDCYHRAFFYVMGIASETRANINQMFNFKEDCIEPEGMHGGWQTSGTVKVCHLAFNLWNGYAEEGQERYFTPEELLSHTTWECKYHIVFAPKFRRQVIYGAIKADVANILSTLCKRKGVEIIETECCPDHIHMLVRIPPNISVSSFMGYLKGKSSLMIFDRHANLKYKYGNRKFWCRGYYVDTCGKNANKIQEYIKNQLMEDQAYDQLSLKEYIDPFTGEPVMKGK